jgi:hypothetical protein
LLYSNRGRVEEGNGKVEPASDYFVWFGIIFVPEHNKQLVINLVLANVKREA